MCQIHMYHLELADKEKHRSMCGGCMRNGPQKEYYQITFMMMRGRERVPMMIPLKKELNQKYLNGSVLNLNF